MKFGRPKTSLNLFTQVIELSYPAILRLWEQGDRFIDSHKISCPNEIYPQQGIGRSYYRCNPHFWQCFWEGGVRSEPSIEVDISGQKYHLEAKATFEPVTSFSSSPRFYQLFKNTKYGFPVNYGYVVEVGVKEMPGFTQKFILTDTCRDSYLPQRIYGYGKNENKLEEGFIWDNVGRDIFIDKFYVTNRQVNEWRILTNQNDLIEDDRKKWPHPALLNKSEQKAYCQFYGKRILEAKFFDAASMFPLDMKNSMPTKIHRTATHWQRDLNRTFLGMARMNAEYQLTPLDCDLVQVKGCPLTYFSTDSATWMGLHYSLGFFSESVENHIEKNKNLKMSSHLLPPSSKWHELGLWSSWDGIQKEDMPVAFRCYEEVSK